MQKFGLDNRYIPAGAPCRYFSKPLGNMPADGEKREMEVITPLLVSVRKKVKKGVDFVSQTRYNVCLYGKLEEGGAIHAQH